MWVLMFLAVRFSEDLAFLKCATNIFQSIVGSSGDARRIRWAVRKGFKNENAVTLFRRKKLREMLRAPQTFTWPSICTKVRSYYHWSVICQSTLKKTVELIYRINLHSLSVLYSDKNSLSFL